MGKFQENLQLPLLFEIAAASGDGELDTRRNYGDLTYVYANLRALYTLPAAYLQQTVSNGQPKFENDVKWAKKQLLESGQLTDAFRKSWTVTEKGIERLRGFVVGLFRRDAEQYILEICGLQTENGEDLLVMALRLVDEFELPSVLARSCSYTELFSNAVDSIQLQSVPNFLVSAYELINSLIKHDYVDPFIEENISLFAAESLSLG